MTWNGEVKGILKSLKVIIFHFLSNYRRGELKKKFFFCLFLKQKWWEKMTVPISMSEFPFYIIEKTSSLQLFSKDKKSQLVSKKKAAQSDKIQKPNDKRNEYRTEQYIKKKKKIMNECM